ncbi:MAG: hypothetical protein B6D39_12480 [Anaerolineae bacterium UTCFX2]|nr:MAG: hypothetical protein B6D39_12480 [Anaerolineae bacterium UTCFX2]
MATGNPAELPSSPSSFQPVLKLGEDLLAIAQQATAAGTSPVSMLARQCEQISAAITRLLGGEVVLWLSVDLLRSHIGKEAVQLAAGAPNAIRPDPTPLMQACFARQELLSEPDQPIRLAAPLSLQALQESPASELGVLQIERNAGPPFLPHEIALFEALVRQSALMLESSLRMTRERWRREQLALVRQVTRNITNLRDLDQIISQVANLILQAFDYYYVVIYTIELGKPSLRFRASAGPLGKLEEPGAPISISVDLGQGIVGHVAQTGQELLARDVRQEPRYRALARLPETRSEFALPLIAQERLLGVLDVQSNQPDDFDEIDQLVLRALASNISIAIEDAQLYQDLSRRVFQVQTIYQVSSAITSILDQEELLNEVVRLIHERFGFPFVHIFSVHPGRLKVLYEAGSGLRSQTIVKEEYTYDLNDPQGLIPWVARTGETALVNDVRQDPRYRPSSLSPENIRSELTVGLVFGGQVLGVLDIQSDQLGAFSEEDRFLFETLADHIAIALRNAVLYRSEVWRRGVADSLREVAGILAADVDLDQVLAAVLTELEHTLPLEAAAIWLLDDDAQMDPPEGASGLYLASVRGSRIADLDLEVGLRPAELLEFNLDEPSLETLPDISTWLSEALASDAPIMRTPHSPPEPLGAVLGFPDDYSAIAAPLRSGAHLLGVLCLVHHTSGRYGSEAYAMTTVFASYAAVAIENARLYEDAQEQAWTATALLQVANATQSVSDLPELLDTVVRITPMLTGVKACALYMFTADGAFIPAAATGLTSDQQVEFERGRFDAEDVPALDRLLTELRPVILREEDWRLANILTAAEISDRPHSASLLVLVPLAARGEILGTFLVDYSTSLSTLSLGKSFETFFDECLAILQGIAYQTAIAVDNIRLSKAQREEAYVSVALLQVAQAIVSSNDLDEALGSIVRITPILVGVKSAMIFLWHEDHDHFVLAQAYGLPREAESRTFDAGEFPLLDAVLATDNLVVLPAPLIADEQDALDCWMELDIPDPATAEALLSEEDSLLMAFPLAVKGKMFGVFLFEEPDPEPGENYTSANANRRLRSKRMEIITGISQHAALAIQNDLLQKETIERGRLERELQLAQQIQAAFLPQQKPELPGWDLQVYWRPARQVGGDFYDFFKLPGNKLGLVIADVADKGMPAALFMTLVRTLVRATVQILESPAAVLARVNDLLVPDAANGMFVTMVYVVLDLSAGELCLANAGHNSPLILHHTGSLDWAKRSSMALGVEPDLSIQEAHWRLEPGDLLVMYTDGVTEAFSPEDEMFGEERLVELLRQFARGGDRQEMPSARTVLETIDQEVLDFSGEAVPYDDLTLLVLKHETGREAPDQTA